MQWGILALEEDVPNRIKSMQFGIAVTPEFEKDHSFVTQMTHRILKDMLPWLPGQDRGRLNSLVVRENGQLRELNLEAARNEWVTRHGEESARVMEALCDCLLASNGDRSVAPAWLSNTGKARISEVNEEDPKKKEAKERIFIAKSGLCRLRETGVINYGDLRGLHYNIAAEVARAIRRWKAQEDLTHQNYHTEAALLASKIKKLDKVTATSLKEFTHLCVDNNWCRWFDKKFQSHIRDFVIPAFREDRSPEMQWNCKGKIEPRPYSLSDDFYPALRSRTHLWDILPEQVDLMELVAAHRAHKEHACFTIDSPVGYLLGDNYTKFTIEAGGSPVNDRIDLDDWTSRTPRKLNAIQGVRLVGQMNISFKDHRLALAIRPHQKKAWWSDIRIWRVNDPAKKTKELTPTTSTVMLEFKRNNRIGDTQIALLKEPMILRLRGKWVIRFSLSVKSVEDQVWGLKKALPSRMDQNVALPTLPNDPLRVLGVDLGMRCPYAYAVSERRDGEVTVLTSGHRNSVYAYNELIEEVKGSIRALNRLVYNKKTEVENGEEVEIIKTAVPVLSRISGLRRDKLEFLQQLDPEKVFIDSVRLVKQVGLAEAKKSYGFIANLLLHYAKTRFGQIKTERKFWVQNQDQAAKFDQDSSMLYLIDLMIRLERKVRTMGYPTGTTVTSNYEKGLLRLRENIRKNFSKQIAIELIDLAVRNECDAIAVEQLSGSKATSGNTAGQNRILLSWAPSILKAAISNAGAVYGLSAKDGELVEVSERDTSQVHYETERWGWRNDADLYYEDGEEIKSVHADVNAAKNIAKRALTHHGNLFSLFEDKKGETEDPKKSSARINGFMTKMFGSISDGKAVIKPGGIFWHGDQWISKEEKQAVQERIQSVVKRSSGSEQ